MGVFIENIIIRNNRISADVFINEEKNKVWYEFERNMEQITRRPANAFLVAFLPIAMRYGGKFEIRGEISRSLYNQMQIYQDILLKWYAGLKRVEIHAENILPDINFEKERKSISCFTGGVDSFYTLIKNKDKIDNILYVWGFDIPLTESMFYNKVRDHIKVVGKKFNKDIIFVKTNLGFEVTNKYASWGEFIYGGAIASIILLMSSDYKLCFIPSSNDYSSLVPRGSHVLIDHLRGCDGLKFIYDGAEASRVEKVNYIADDKIVQEHLRVCYKSRDDYNCSECEKCVRTMASLEAINKLKCVKTFYKPLIIDDINKIELDNEPELKFAEATMQVALENNKLELANQIKKQITNYNVRNLIQYVNHNFEILMENPDFFKLTNKFVDWHILQNTKCTIKKIINIVPKKLLKK